MNIFNFKKRNVICTESDGVYSFPVFYDEDGVRHIIKLEKDIRTFDGPPLE